MDRNLTGAAKPLAELTVDDLEAHMVWRLGDRDEVEMAEPVEAEEIAADPDDLLIARTRFRLANGRTLIGFTSPGDWGGADFVPPVIIHEGRHLPLADDAFQPTDSWLALAPSPEQVFPVTATPDVRVGGKSVSRLYGRDGNDPRRKPAKQGGFWRGVRDFLDGLGDGH